MMLSSSTRSGGAGRIILVGLTIIAVASGAGLAWWWNRGRALREAKAAYQSAEYELALRWVNWHLRLFPNDINGLRLRARCLSRQGEFARAEPLFQQIPQLEAEDYYLIGHGHLRSSGANKAIGPLRKSIDLAPTSEARRSLAVAYYELDRIDLALEQAKIVAEDEKEGDIGLALLGELYFSRDLPRASYDAFAKLLARNPQLRGVPQTRPVIVMNQIESLLKLGEPEKAAELMEQLGDLDQDVRGLRLRGQLRQQQGDSQGAEKDWRRVLELDPANSIVVELALLTLERGNYEEAVQWLLDSAERYPTDPAIHQHLALAYNRLGNATAAADHQQIAKRLRDQIEQKKIRAKGSPATPGGPLSKNL